MDKLKVSQILKLVLIAALLLITPLISSSQRTPYLYFIVNLLIIALGAEAGLLSFFSEASNDKNKPADTITTKATTKQQLIVAPSVIKVVEKCASEKIVSVAKVDKDATKIQKCPSTPSLFFIDSVENSEGKDDEVVKQKLEEDKDKEELLGELSGQELFNKAETFIGNFYNQLKMQREESWSRFSDFYQKAL